MEEAKHQSFPAASPSLPSPPPPLDPVSNAAPRNFLLPSPATPRQAASPGPGPAPPGSPPPPAPLPAGAGPLGTDFVPGAAAEALRPECCRGCCKGNTCLGKPGFKGPIQGTNSGFHLCYAPKTKQRQPIWKISLLRTLQTYMKPQCRPVHLSKVTAHVQHQADAAVWGLSQPLLGLPARRSTA
ncbi:uncharacterized protein LOC129212571 [Grus americana]|uniref:uncharacterized protein LOC129212571 n=1 Tax=Grus americana TaxID=9117 RepID=UPI002407A292|nr:uncharacterized protein LOC129212571 [Grus americana]